MTSSWFLDDVTWPIFPVAAFKNESWAVIGWHRFGLQTEWRTGGQTDERTDRRTDEVKPVYPLNFVGEGVGVGYNDVCEGPGLEVKRDAAKYNGKLMARGYRARVLILVHSECEMGQLTYQECCVKSGYEGQGQVITSHSIWWNYLSLSLITASGTTLVIQDKANPSFRSWAKDILLSFFVCFLSIFVFCLFVCFCYVCLFVCFLLILFLVSICI